MGTDPGRLLITHRAPHGLVERALTVPPPSRDWRPVLAMAAALLVGIGLGRFSTDDRSIHAENRPVEIVSNQEQTPVRLVIHAPDADSVGVAASFNGWDFNATPMTRGNDGTFHATLFLESGQHEYMFVVDGQDWVTDPSAAVTRDDGFGNRNALLEI